MAAEHIKVAAGQIWKDRTNGKEFTITRVDAYSCYFIKNGQEREFAELTIDGFPDGWFGDWHVVNAKTSNGPIKVAIGQVYVNRAGDRYTVTSIKDKHVFCKDPYGEVDEFGYVTEDGFPNCWGGGWHLVEGAAPAKKEENKKEAKATGEAEDKLFAFFSRPQPGNCKCGMPKEQCDYHRDD